MTDVWVHGRRVLADRRYLTLDAARIARRSLRWQGVLAQFRREQLELQNRTKDGEEQAQAAVEAEAVQAQKVEA